MDPFGAPQQTGSKKVPNLSICFFLFCKKIRTWKQMINARL